MKVSLKERLRRQRFDRINRARERRPKLDSRHGRRVRLMENRGGWRFNGLLGTCVAISARDEFMLLEVEHDPDEYWPAGSRVIVELGTDAHGTTTAVFEPEVA